MKSDEMLEVRESELCQHDDGVWTAEASQLRIAPGAWPARMRFVFANGDGRTSVIVAYLESETSEDGGLVVTYACAHRPVTLIVFND